ncbi:hypothetical protein HID58_082588 [Brassica napus]|uniref:Uncharacterized protein n=1 Tax=Brassica napus TaxID=3708 RepID=A0ABQ7YCN5_BRANA|nr:hypothetical protein HID58_082588 [Brassica napus]
MTSIKSTPEFELDNNGSATDGFEEISRNCFSFFPSLTSDGELEADTDKLMREYRAQLDAERALKLSKGRNYSSDKSRKDKKDRDSSKKKKSKKRKSRHLVAMKTNQEDQDQVLKDQRRRISTSPAETNVSSRSKDETDGPVPLSRFFGNLKS